MSIPKSEFAATHSFKSHYWTLDFSAEYYITKNCRVMAGVSNLTDQRYYSRVFGSRIEPAPGLNGYGGISIGF